MFRQCLAVLMGIVALLLCAISPGHAVLKAVGPISAPVPPGDGFPLWYQDTTNLVLDLCLPAPGQERNQGYCLTLPADFPSPNDPVVFPTNYAGEGFWWSGGSTIPVPNGSADLVLALEAAFSTGETPINGDQVAFGRVRIRIDVDTVGTHTVRHPYGVSVFEVTAADVAGARGINFTSDIGIGAPGDFTGALQSAIGPFLVAANCANGAQLPFFTDALLPGKQYVGPPGVDVCVIGGAEPTAINANGVHIFRVEGPPGAFGEPSGVIETTNFQITGRRFLGTPIKIDRATYTRNAAGAVSVDVFGTSGLTATAATATSGAVVDSPMAGVGATGLFAHLELGVVAIPANASITATADDPFAALAPPPGTLTPTTVTAALQDLITITTAQYNLATNQLTILAASSDQDPVNGPTLTEQYLQSLVPPVALNNGTVTVVSGVLVPPAEVIVNSSAGGASSKAVEVVNVTATGVVGFFRNGLWILDLNGNGVLEATDFSYSFGNATDSPVTGDWDGAGRFKVGVFRSTGDWYVDYNGNGKMDTCVNAPVVPGAGEDLCMPFGQPGDVPVVGKWTGAGASKIGVFRNGDWFLDYNGNGTYDGCGAPADPTKDWCAPLGQPGDIPITGDWDGSGTTKIGVFRNGDWFLDYNGNGIWDGCGAPADPTKDWCAPLGQPGDIPITGDWDRSDLNIASKIGVVRAGTWFLDMNGNGAWDGEPTDRTFTFGLAGDKPVSGSW